MMDKDKPPENLDNLDISNNIYDQKIIINSLLCYCTNKYKNIEKKKLLSIMSTFFSVNQIHDAKNLLLSVVKSLFPNEKVPGNKIHNESDPFKNSKKNLEDIVSIFQFVEDANFITKLPIFVSSKPNAMPSENIEEGDLQTLLTMITTIHDSLVNVFDKISNVSIINNKKFEKIDELLYSIKNNIINHNKNLPEFSCDYQNNNDLSKIENIHMFKQKDSSNLNTLNVTTDMTYKKSNLFSDIVRQNISSHDSSDADADKFKKVSHRGVKRNRKESPVNITNILPLHSKTNSKHNKVIGNGGQNQNLQAAKNIVKKAAFYLGNCSNTTTEDDIKKYVENLNTKLIKISKINFKNNPNSLNNTIDNDTSNMTNKNTSFSYHILIEEKDVVKFSDAKNWPDGIILRAWNFKDNNKQNNNV